MQLIKAKCNDYGENIK